MIKIEYETKDFIPRKIEVPDKEALKTLIAITAEGGCVRWVEKT